jgi:hypothetical protein
LARRLWRRPVAALIGVCRSCPFQAAELDSVALVESCQRSLLSMLQSHRREPLRRCWIDHPYGEEEITRLEDELFPAMESFLALILDAVFRVAGAIDQQHREAEAEHEAEVELSLNRAANGSGC